MAENEPPWIHWFTEADARGLAGESLLALDRPVSIHRLNSPRCQRKLADFRAAATPYARSAAVREFDAKHRDLAPRPDE